MNWKAGPEKPRTPFCWMCSRRFHGRVFARVRDEAGNEHDVHKDCLRLCKDFGIVLRSTTARKAEAT